MGLDNVLYEWEYHCALGMGLANCPGNGTSEFTGNGTIPCALGMGQSNCPGNGTSPIPRAHWIVPFTVNGTSQLLCE